MKSGVVVAAVILSCFSVGVYAENVWVGAQGNAGHTGYVPITTNPANYHLLWDKKLSAPENVVDFMPFGLIVDNTMYYAFEEDTAQNKYIDSVLVALDTATGNEKWRTTLNQTQDIDDEQAVYYVNHALYVSMQDNKNSYLYNYDAQNGKLLKAGLSVTSSWIVDADAANFYAITNKNLLEQLNPNDLSVKWSAPYKYDKYTAVRGYGLNQHYFMVESDTINTVMDFYNLKDGTQDKSVNVTDVPWSDLVRYPVIDNDTNAAYVVLGRWATPTPTLYSLDLNKHAIRWSVANQNGSVNPVVANNVVYSVSKDAMTLNAIDAKAGVVLWTWQLTDDDYINTFKPPVVTKDVIFIPSKNHTYAVSLTTHQTVWQVDKTGYLAVGDNKLFIKTYNQQNNSSDYVTAYALM